MATTADQNTENKRRPATALRSQPPFHLRLPDITPPRKPRTVSPTSPGPQRRPASRTPAHDPVANVRARLSRKRYEDGHQNVTGLIDRMRDRRRKLFGRLWIASVVLTALSIVALAVEVIQSLSFTQATADSVPAGGDSEVARPVVRKSARSPRSVVPAQAQFLASELPEAAKGENPVKSALYTTDRPGRPRGVWLDGTINDNDSDTSDR